MAQEVQNGEAEHGVTKEVTFSAVKLQLFVKEAKANDALQFYKAAFGAKELNRVMHPKRKADQDLPLILSAELKLGSSSILVSDYADGSSAPVNTVGAGCVICLETEDVETAVAKAVKAGAVSESNVAEGDGACFVGRVDVKDPFGFVWSFCSPAEKRAEVVDA